MFEDEEDTMGEALDDATYRVFVVHNFFNGRCYDYSGRTVNVQGRTPEDALYRARKDKLEIERDLRAQRHWPSRKLLIRKSDTYHLKDSDIHSPALVEPFNKSKSLVKEFVCNT